MRGTGESKPLLLGSLLLWAGAWWAAVAGDLCVEVRWPGGTPGKRMFVAIEEAPGAGEVIRKSGATDEQGRVCFLELRDGLYEVRVESLAERSEMVARTFHRVPVDVLRRKELQVLLSFGDARPIELGKEVRVGGPVVLDGKPAVGAEYEL